MLAFLISPPNIKIILEEIKVYLPLFIRELILVYTSELRFALEKPGKQA